MEVMGLVVPDAIMPEILLGILAALGWIGRELYRLRADFASLPCQKGEMK